MAKYLISFPGPAMNVPEEDLLEVAEAAHAVIREAKDAGVYVFGGGINEDVAPLMVAADGTVTNETYPQTRELSGGFCVLELPSRDAAIVRPSGDQTGNTALLPGESVIRRRSVPSGRTVQISMVPERSEWKAIRSPPGAHRGDRSR